MKHSIKVSRIVLLAVLLVGIMVAFSVRLLGMQVVDGASYVEMVEQGSVKTQQVSAARGEILDRFGRPFAVNHTQLDLSFDRAFLPYGEENRIILDLIDILQEDGLSWKDSLPISDTEPYTFLPDSEREIETLRNTLRLIPSATVEDAMYWLIEQYDLGEYDPATQRLLAGVRYTMLQEGFSMEIPFTFAEDISIDTAGKIMERSEKFPGVDVVRTSVREYPSGQTAPHIVGQVGPIYAEEYQQLREKGYSLNDVVGKSGIEAAFEEQLRGTDGERTILLDNKNNVVNVYESKPVVPGKTIVLTIDQQLQALAQDSLRRQIEWLQQNAPNDEGRDAEAGAVVVVSVKTGEVLVAANYPSYDVETFRNDYQSLLNDPLQPMFDRALRGTYSPGSIYKPSVAIGGLAQGVIDTSTEFYCGRVYTYFEDYQPTCMGFHQDINVMDALKVSCNIFFYELGRQLGIDTINDYSAQLGLGVPTGIEITEARGTLSSPESRAAHGLDWNPGDVIQSAIGQLDNAFSPLQLANYAATIANHGQRMKLTLVKSINDYTLENATYEHTPEVAQQVDAPAEAFDAVIEGMHRASSMPDGTAYRYFGDYPISVAAKTGTPQTKEYPNSTFMAFAPIEDPEIAICVVIEKGWHGSNSAQVAKDIFDAYFFGQSAAEVQSQENVLLP